MKLKQKSWVWKLSYPFAHANFTTIGDVIYHPKNRLPSESVIRHEEIHSIQQKEVGLVKFLLLYLLAFPLFYNPFRFKWEYEAYASDPMISHDTIVKKLNSKSYGWLIG